MCLLEPRDEKYHLSYRIRLKRDFQLYVFTSFMNKDPNDDFDHFHLFSDLQLTWLYLRIMTFSWISVRYFSCPKLSLCFSFVVYRELTCLDYFVVQNAWNDKTIFVPFCLPQQKQRVWPLSSVDTIFFSVRRYGESFSITRDVSGISKY